MTTQVKITVQQLIKALLDEEKFLQHRYVQRLSDLPPEDLAELEKAWPQVPTRRRQSIMEDVEGMSEDNYTLSFEGIATIAAADSDPVVRETALRVLMDYESPEMMNFFMDKLSGDPVPAVRAAAATGLGKYVYLGEIEEISANRLRRLEGKLLSVFQSDEPELVRRRVLESMGFSSREEIPALIEAAYKSKSKDWLVSALFAMGRSANKAWEPYVFEQLHSDNPEVYTEAARAAGELELAKAKPRLLKMLKDDDADARAAAAWSLSQLGGEGVQQALEKMMQDTEDDEELNFIDAALENLAFTEETNLFGLIEMDEADEAALDEVDDDDDDDDEDDFAFYTDEDEDDE